MTSSKGLAWHTSEGPDKELDNWMIINKGHVFIHIILAECIGHDIPLLKSFAVPHTTSTFGAVYLKRLDHLRHISSLL